MVTSLQKGDFHQVAFLGHFWGLWPHTDALLLPWHCLDPVALQPGEDRSSMR